MTANKKANELANRLHKKDAALIVVNEKIKSERELTNYLSKKHNLNLGYDDTYWKEVIAEIK